VPSDKKGLQTDTAHFKSFLLITCFFRPNFKVLTCEIITAMDNWDSSLSSFYWSTINNSSFVATNMVECSLTFTAILILIVFNSFPDDLGNIAVAKFSN